MALFAAFLLALPAAAQYAAPPVPKPYVVEVAFPTLELFVLRTPLLAASDGVPLSEDERAQAWDLFGPSLDYDAVRIVFVDFKTAKAMVAGNVIRMPREAYTRRWLMHELTHVWQFQTHGPGYVSKALSEHLDKGDHVYDYRLVEGRPLGDYPVEVQAEIVEDYCGSLKRQLDPRYQALIAQLKLRRPAFRTNDSAVEAASRLPLHPRYPGSPLLPPVYESGQLPAVAPQLEIRF